MKTSTTSRVIALTVPLAALPLARTHAAYDAFLKIEGIEGESNNQQHRDEIDVLSFSWGTSNPAALSNHTGGSGGGKVSLDALKVTKRVDKASPKLFLACFRDDIEPAPVILSLVKTYPGEEHADDEIVKFFEIELSGVRVARVESSVNPRRDERDGDTGPDLSERTETVTFSFEEIKVTYSPQGADGRYKRIDDHEAVSVEIVNTPPEVD